MLVRRSICAEESAYVIANDSGWPGHYGIRLFDALCVAFLVPHLIFLSSIGAFGRGFPVASCSAYSAVILRIDPRLPSSSTECWLGWGDGGSLMLFSI
jgi:hypothetical protein